MEASIILIAVAVILRLLAGAGYLLATIRNQVKPSPVSWFFWGFTALIAFMVQIHEQAGAQALVTLALGLSPMAIFLIAFLKQRRKFQFTSIDIISAGLASVGVILWLITKDPMMALLFSIIADIFSGIPTVIKSFKDPDSERALPYLLSMLSMVATMAAIPRWTAAAYAFPLYIFLINLLFFTLIASRVGLRYRRWMRAVRALFKRYAFPVRSE